MSEIKVTMVQPDGREVTFAAATGSALMPQAKAQGVDGILGDCGDGCACGTCHVYVDEHWRAVVGPPDDIEDLTLDMSAHVRQDNSRLSCQITLTDAMDGLRVTVAPQ